jgi:TonB family protein
MWIFLAMWLVAPALGQQVRIGDAGILPNGGMVAPTILKSTMALYTAEAANRAIEGTVTVQARIGVNGDTEVLRVLKGLGFGLDEIAMATVSGWQFSPALRNGAPVEVIAQIDVPYNLRVANAFRMGNGVTLPKILQRIEPQYTPEARAARLRGTVVLQALIKTDGSVEILSVIRGMELGMTQRAIDALRQWRFKPGTRLKDARDVNILLNIEVNFNLR